jgi:hypothetical protein
MYNQTSYHQQQIPTLLLVLNQPAHVFLKVIISYNDFSWAGKIRSIYNVLTCQRTPGSDFMGAKILDIYNVLIGHGIPGNGKVFRN